MAWDSGLTGTALDIARCAANPLRVMAGPGTGKSFAMKRRVARLLEEGAVADRILAVTFKRNAAKSLLDDLGNLGVPGCENIECGTLHSFCFSLLSDASVFAFSGRKPRPLVTFSTAGCLCFEAEPLLADLGRNTAFGGKRKISKHILAFEAAWARLQSETPGWAATPLDQEFENTLVSWLTFHQAMLIGELVAEALKYMRGNPTAPALHAYDHVIVDEYQDLNKAEQVLLDQLSQNGNQAIVGDVDQSIYSFRHANPEGITEFSTHHPTTHDESLAECRRCPRTVVALADRLIRHNHPPAAVARLNPRPANAAGQVDVVQWSSLIEEAAGIADFIASLVTAGHDPGDILVLSPRKLIGYGIRDAVRSKGIPVHSFYNEEPLEERRAKEAFNLLALMADPNDRVALRWWLGSGSPSWRSGQYATLRGHCETTGAHPTAVLQALSSGTIAIKNTAELLKRFNELSARIAGLTPLPLADVVDMLFPAAQPWAGGLRAAALQAMPSSTTLTDLRDRITTAVTQPEVPESKDFVRVMSLHKSKGLTSKTVIVAGCIEGVIPVIDSDAPLTEQARNLEEQRRLFYVAITRCTDRLVLSSTSYLDRSLAFKIGARLGAGNSTVNSRFMHELGATLTPAKRGIDWRTAGF